MIHNSIEAIFRWETHPISFFANGVEMNETPVHEKGRMSSDIGIYGLTSQGINLALNMASKGLLVTVGNKSSDKVGSIVIL